MLSAGQALVTGLVEDFGVHCQLEYGVLGMYPYVIRSIYIQ